MEEQNEKRNPKKEFFLKNFKWYEHLAAGWPLILVFAGGAIYTCNKVTSSGCFLDGYKVIRYVFSDARVYIGGACGGLAYALNGKIFNSKLSNILKYVFSFLIGISAILLYLLVVVILSIIFPGLFKK